MLLQLRFGDAFQFCLERSPNILAMEVQAGVVFAASMTIEIRDAGF